MREIHTIANDVDTLLEQALREKQHLDAERWRTELRPRALKLFATRAKGLRWSRALVTAVVEELFLDDLFAQIAGDVTRVSSRRWPSLLAVAVAFRRSWRRNGLTELARLLRVPLTLRDLASLQREVAATRSRSSRRRLSGSSRVRQGSSLRSDPARRGSRP